MTKSNKESKKEEIKKRKVNFVIYSLNGGIFSADTAISENKPITDGMILNEVFKSNDIDSISYTKIETSSFNGIDTDEAVRIYFSSDKEQVWNYNPIMSVYMGYLVYSSVIVFVSENETEDGNGGEPMPNETFMSIVYKFIETCTQVAYSSVNEGEEKKQKEEEKKSPMFDISKICFYTDISTKSMKIKPGKDKVHLDEYWSSNYIGKYSPEFVIKDLIDLDEDTNELSKAYLLMKPGLTTLYLIDSGIAKVFFNQISKESFEKAYKKIDEYLDDLGSDASEEDIEREKQRALQMLYN